MTEKCVQAKAEDISELLYEVYDVPSGICEQIKDMVQQLEAIEKGKCTDIIDNVMAFKNDNANSSESLNCIERVNDYLKNVYDYKEIIEEVQKDINTVKQALQRLDKYEQILGSGRLTDRNYKNTTLDLDSCKPYVRLGQLEDIYEEGKKNG